MLETETKCRLCLKLREPNPNIDRKLSEAVKVIFDIEVSTKAPDKILNLMFLLLSCSLNVKQ